MADPYRLFLLAVLASLGACERGQPGEACMPIAATVTACPAPTDINPHALQGSCGSQVLEVVGAGERLDHDPRTDALDSPSCCYPVRETAATCKYGRPLRVDDAPVLAPTIDEPGWAAALAVRTEALAPDVRDALVERWTHAALDEHASVAAFSRAALDLLRHGAPPELIEQAHAAALDEVRHARHGFAIASALRGRPIGPGAYPLGASVPLAADLVAVAVEAALDGCIGETVASLLAWEAAELCEEPAIRDVLRGIAADEQRHALLGWRTVWWALERGGAPVRDAVAAVFAATARDGVAVPLPGDFDDREALARIGLLDRHTARRHAARSLEQVILPAAATLLGGAARRFAREAAPAPA